MNRLLRVVVCLFIAFSIQIQARGQAKGGLAPALVAAPAAPAKVEATTVKSVDDLLAGIDAKVSAIKTRQEELDKKAKSLNEEEARIRSEAMEAGKKMWAMTDAGADSGGDQEMVALKKKISEMEAQIKELREQMQRKLENDPEFLQRKIKLQDTQKALLDLRKGRGETMQEKAKLNAELQQLERDRLPLLQRKEKEVEEAKKAQETKAAGAK